MREIKFRAWEKNLKEIIPINSINFETKMVNIKFAWRLFNEVELMQYTGLKDRNGVEIYEGDIITIFSYSSSYTVLVEFNNSAFVVKNVKTEHTLHRVYQDVLNELFSIEVIGNIHENPGLMS